MKQKKKTSYQKLKGKNEDLWDKYTRAMKRLKECGQGILGDDYLTGN